MGCATAGTSTHRDQVFPLLRQFPDSLRPRNIEGDSRSRESVPIAAHRPRPFYPLPILENPCRWPLAVGFSSKLRPGWSWKQHGDAPSAGHPSRTHSANLFSHQYWPRHARAHGSSAPSGSTVPCRPKELDILYHTMEAFLGHSSLSSAPPARSTLGTGDRERLSGGYRASVGLLALPRCLPRG